VVKPFAAPLVLTAAIAWSAGCNDQSPTTGEPPPAPGQPDPSQFEGLEQQPFNPGGPSPQEQPLPGGDASPLEQQEYPEQQQPFPTPDWGDESSIPNYGEQPDTGTVD